MKIVWPGKPVIWIGHVEGTDFHVEDILDKGVSEQAISGHPPALKPIAMKEIEGAGGQLFPE